MCSASHLVCSYVLRNSCPASSWRSRNVPSYLPDTHALAVRRRIAPQLRQDAVDPLCRLRVVARAHEDDDLAVALLEQPREHLHAEEPGRPGEEDGRPHAVASSITWAGAVPIAWKPPSTCTISPVIARAMSDSRNRIADATGAGSPVSQPSGAWRSHA